MRARIEIRIEFNEISSHLKKGIGDNTPRFWQLSLRGNGRSYGATQRSQQSEGKALDAEI
jgi:hypothetical protein